MRSVFAIAGLAAAVAAAPAAESSSCPATTTEYQTYGGLSREYTTVTEYPYSPGPTETKTETERIATATATHYVFAGPYVTTCAEPETVTVYVLNKPKRVTSIRILISNHRNVEHTATTYTGDYSSSSLRPSTSCAPTRAIIDVYPEGTTTITYTETRSAPAVTSFTTIEIETTNYVMSSGSTTSTIEQNECTETVTSTAATASSTVTQALKCAATNLIGTDGIAGKHYRGSNDDGIASYGNEASTTRDEDGAGANKDASACCQACQDDENCAAAIFAGTSYTYPRPSLPYCQLFNNNKDTSGASCGLGFTIFPGDKQIASTGCGYIAENVYWEGECPEGLTPRQCEQGGYVGQFAP